MGATEQIGSAGGRIDLGRVLVSLVVAIPPAFGLSFPLELRRGRRLPLAVPGRNRRVHGGSLSESGLAGQGRDGLSYLAIESFLFPLAVLISRYGVITETSGVLAQLGAGFSALVALSVSWLVSWMVGVVLYLISRRFGSG